MFSPFALFRSYPIESFRSVIQSGDLWKIDLELRKNPDLVNQKEEYKKKISNH